MRLTAVLTAAYFSLFVTMAAAGPTFAPLSGRVVDNAGLLGSQTHSDLTAQLKAHEDSTGNQIVFTSVPDLQGYDIETFGYQLARHWGIGEKDKSNGVVLIVARKERKIRIEVGYGLEGLVTDATSANIIHMIIKPEFKKGNFDQGIQSGVSAIVEVLNGDYRPRKRKVDKGFPSPLFGILLFLFIFSIVVSSVFGGVAVAAEDAALVLA